VVIRDSSVGSSCDVNLTKEPKMTDEMMNLRCGQTPLRNHPNPARMTAVKGFGA
jgi:hypothetical protein